MIESGCLVLQLRQGTHVAIPTRFPPRFLPRFQGFQAFAGPIRPAIARDH